MKYHSKSTVVPGFQEIILFIEPIKNKEICSKMIHNERAELESRRAAGSTHTSKGRALHTRLLKRSMPLREETEQSYELYILLSQSRSSQSLNPPLPYIESLLLGLRSCVQIVYVGIVKAKFSSSSTVATVSVLPVKSMVA